jgi:hypothetical protein
MGEGYVSAFADSGVVGTGLLCRRAPYHHALGALLSGAGARLREASEQGDKSESALLWRLWARGIEQTAAIALISRTGGEQ